MIYTFNSTMENVESDALAATSTNGVVYTENNRLHIKTNKKHLVYKFDGSPVGWYQRNNKTLDDCYLGKGACPTAELETVVVKNETIWSALIKVNTEDGE